MKQRNQNITYNSIIDSASGQVRITPIELRYGELDATYVRLSSSSVQNISSSLSVTGTLNLTPNVVFSSNQVGYHLLSTTQHLIMSSSAGSTVAISGNLRLLSGSVTLKEAGTFVAIKQGYLLGLNTLELCTTDSSGTLTTKIGARGSDDANIEFYKGNSGSLVATMVHTPTGDMTIMGDFSGSGGFKTFLGPFVDANTAANNRFVMGLPPNVDSASSYMVMPFPGSIIAICARESTAGVGVAGAQVTFSASINGITNATAIMNIPVGQTQNYATFPKDTITFTAGQHLGITIATTAAYTSTTNDYTAFLVVEI